MKKIEILTLEIGSTITKANAFSVVAGKMEHLAQGFAATSIEQGDVSLGVEEAIKDLEKKSNISTEGAKIFINSSAAGGLKMTVHGLTMSMTARAAKEASLGAGAVIKNLTAGLLDRYALEEIEEISPNLILLAGGIDHGEKDITLQNAQQLLKLSCKFSIPLIYAGNKVLVRQIKDIAKAEKAELWIAENVFPQVDELNVTPLRKLIHEAFAKHIIHAPGMDKIGNYTSDPIIPTPGVVLLAAKAIYDFAGDVAIVDVGGATTDVHSVTDGSLEFKDLLIDPEPREKRTVEGDLGVFVNAKTILDLDKKGIWKKKESNLARIPTNKDEKELTTWLTQMAVVQGVQRHAGTISDFYTPSGRKKVVRGKDLSAIKYLIGTGGALSKNESGLEILGKIALGAGEYLFPPKDVKIFIDSNYLLSAYGTMVGHYPDEVKRSLQCLLHA